MSEPVIVCDQLVKGFGAQPVLDGVSLTVSAGETVAVLGRSGTGKSVLLKTLVALMDPDSGSVKVFGKNLHTLDEHHRLLARREIGYVFQGSALFDSLDVCHNVGFSLSQARLPEAEIRKRAQECLAMVGLEQAIDKMPSELSGGMQKRVGLARAIVGRPRLILYDEPTTGLDPLTTDVINQIILRLRRKLGVTSVVVTHDIRSAFTIADRIVMLDQGRVVVQGTPQEIQACDNAWVHQFITGYSGVSESSGSRQVVKADLSHLPRIDEE